MTSHARDQQLLLLGHNQLPFLARMAALSHLRNCAPCSARQAQFATVSLQIASSLRPASLPAWRPAKPAGLLGNMSLAQKLLLISALLLVALTTAVMVTNVVRSSGNRAPAPGIYGPCRPDLPNDKCR